MNGDQLPLNCLSSVVKLLILKLVVPVNCVRLHYIHTKLLATVAFCISDSEHSRSPKILNFMTMYKMIFSLKKNFIYLTVRKKRTNRTKHLTSHLSFGITTHRQIRHTACNSTKDAVAHLCLQSAALCAKLTFPHKLPT